MIELLTVVAIIATISALVAANYHQGGKQAALEMEINKLAQNARRAQEWALAAHEVGGVSRPGYGIYCDSSSPGSYILYAKKSGSTSTRYEAGDVVMETVALDKNVEIASCSPDHASVNFAPPDPTTIMNSGGATFDTAEIELRIKNTAITHKTVMNRAGLIYVDVK